MQFLCPSSTAFVASRPIWRTPAPRMAAPLEDPGAPSWASGEPSQDPGSSEVAKADEMRNYGIDELLELEAAAAGDELEAAATAAAAMSAEAERSRRRRDAKRALTDAAYAEASSSPASSSPLSLEPAAPLEFLSLLNSLRELPATPLALAQLTDAIDYPVAADGADAENSALAGAAAAARRWRRGQLLTELLKSDRAAYLETVGFLNIPRAELPNRQDVPLRPCDPPPRAAAVPAEALVDGLTADGLVPDCALDDTPMGENPLEALLLRVTRDIYAGETGVPRTGEGGIRGLLAEMRAYMLSADGAAPEAQQGVLIRTLRTLMTPALPPFYRIFMGGVVPSHDPDDSRVGADPKWLADAFAAVREKLPEPLAKHLAPGNQLGPWFYAPALTAVVSPYAFGFLVGPATLNRRSDGEIGGLVVEKCKFLQESNCKGMCLNSCKLPAQALFGELGLPLRVSPNFETQECQWSFGEAAPPPADDPTWPKGCVQGCTSREAMKELSGAAVGRVCE